MVHSPIVAFVQAILSIEAAFVEHWLEFLFLDLIRQGLVGKVMGRVAHSQLIRLFLDGVIRVAIHIPFSISF
jgi:hypothetical protein